MVEVFFFDTYAFLELLDKNPNYAPYAKAGIMTSKLNIFELATSLYRSQFQSTPEFLKQQFKSVVEFDLETIQSAAQFWVAQRKSNISMTDAIGYVLSLQHGISFLTGDEQFEGLPNVRFVK